MARNCRGFTLVEISIVLLIIGLILGGIMYNSGFLIGNTKATSTAKLITDLSGAVADFKAQYHYFPGDLPTAKDNISGTVCSGNGNGLIDAGEVACATEELVLSGAIKGSQTGLVSPFGSAPDVSVRSVASSQVYQKVSTTAFAPTVRNVIEVGTGALGIPCEGAITIDNKIDDGDTTKGNVITYPPCISNASGVMPTTTVLDAGL